LFVSTVPRAQLENVRQLLGECTLFRGLEIPDRTELVSRARVRSFAAGDTIFLMGSAGDSLMAVLSGRVRISMTSPDGKEIVLAILEPGEHFGEVALLDGKERTADASAMTACSLAVLERRDVLSFLEQHPSAWLRIVEVLCARLRNTDQHIAEIALLGLPARLAKALLRMLSTEEPAPARGSPPIKVSQRALGTMVGASRESINKCLGDWQRRRIVQVDGTAISIHDRAALERIAEGA
jgi:CRP/FNR family transcriptional regulator, cyclic AMP receptor protein